MPKKKKTEDKSLVEKVTDKVKDKLDGVKDKIDEVSHENLAQTWMNRVDPDFFKNVTGLELRGAKVEDVVKVTSKDQLDKYLS